MKASTYHDIALVMYHYLFSEVSALITRRDLGPLQHLRRSSFMTIKWLLQPAISCLKLKIETEQGVKYLQS